VAIPLCEELAFRGVLLQGLHRYLGFGWANGLQALLFASLHESWQIWPFYFAIGWVGGSFARRSGALAAPLLLHAANNALAFARIAQGLGAG